MKILIILSLTALILFPSLVSADCADLGDFTNWVRVGPRRILFYEGNRPIAIVNVVYCDVYPWSRIRLLRSYVCDSDSIMIDGEVCNLMSMKAEY